MTVTISLSLFSFPLQCLSSFFFFSGRLIFPWSGIVQNWVLSWYSWRWIMFGGFHFYMIPHSFVISPFFFVLIILGEVMGDHLDKIGMS